MPDDKFKPIPVDETVEYLPEDKPEEKSVEEPKVMKQPPLDIVPGATVARPRGRQSQDQGEGKVFFKQINVSMFDLTDKEQLAAYQEVLNKIEQGNAIRALKTFQMPCPTMGKWMILLHWREIDWEKTKAAIGRTE